MFCSLLICALAIVGLSFPLCARATGASDATKSKAGFDTLIVVGLSPLGLVEEDFFFGLYFSSRLAREGVSIEPGFPAGWATSLSLRLIEGADGVLELHDPTGLVRRFVARRSADQWVADDV